jgi:hypothetical protein
VFLQKYFRLGFGLVVKLFCKKKVEADVGNYINSNIGYSKESKDESVVKKLKNFKLVQHLPPYSQAFKEYQKRSVMKEYIISTHNLGLEKDLRNHTIGLVNYT